MYGIRKLFLWRARGFTLLRLETIRPPYSISQDLSIFIVELRRLKKKATTTTEGIYENRQVIRRLYRIHRGFVRWKRKKRGNFSQHLELYRSPKRARVLYSPACVVSAFTCPDGRWLDTHVYDSDGSCNWISRTWYIYIFVCIYLQCIFISLK